MGMEVEIFIQAVANGIMIGGIYALVAVGLTLIFGVMDVVNFAQGEFVMLGMFVTYLVHLLLGLDPIVSIIIVLPIMFCLGAHVCVNGYAYHFGNRSSLILCQTIKLFNLAGRNKKLFSNQFFRAGCFHFYMPPFVLTRCV